MSTTEVKKKSRAEKKKYEVYAEKPFGAEPNEQASPPIPSASIVMESKILHLKINIQGESPEEDPHHPDPNTIEQNFLEYSPMLNVPEPYSGSVDQTFSFLPALTISKEGMADGAEDPGPGEEYAYVPQIQLDMANEEKMCFISNAQTTVNKRVFKNLHNISMTCGNNVHCWWCCHAFQWNPVMLPVQKRDDGYDVVGNFCTPECCVSYSLQSGVRYGDVWKQYMWLHEIYLRKVNEEVVKFKPAPPRETLSIFGGPYPINEFRKLVDNYSVDVKHTLAPLYPSNGFTEEVITEYANTRKFVPINKTRITKATEELRLKRNKKKSTENTLEKFMNLKILTQA